MDSKKRNNEPTFTGTAETIAIPSRLFHGQVCNASITLLVPELAKQVVSPPSSPSSASETSTISTPRVKMKKKPKLFGSDKLSFLGEFSSEHKKYRLSP